MSTTRTLSVELPDFVADALQNRAERNGTTPDALARAAILNGLHDLETAAAAWGETTPEDQELQALEDALNDPDDDPTAPRPLPLCDDLCDAATEAIEAVNARIERLNLDLTPASFEALRALLCEALKLAQARSADL